MHQRNPEELSVSFRLSREVIDEITILAFAEAGLSEIEQTVFSLRHRLTEDTPGNGLMAVEDITMGIFRDSGEAVSDEWVMSVLERAEAKVDRFAWHTLELSARRHLGMDYAEQRE